MNNHHSWLSINTQLDHEDLGTFLREYNTLNLLLYELDIPHTRYTFSGGWEDFLANSLHVKCCIGGSPLTVIPGSTYPASTTADVVFGSTLLTDGELQTAIFDRGENILVRPDCLCPKMLSSWLTLLYAALLTPSTTESHVYVLY